MFSQTHLAIITEMSKGHIQLRELTKRVNKVCKKHYLESSVSARIRDLSGLYETLTECSRGNKYVYYIAKDHAVKHVANRLAEKARSAA